MIRFALFLLLLSAGSFTANCQAINTAWIASFNSFQLNKKFSIHLDVQERSGDRYSTMSTLLLRPGLNYKLNDAWILTAGYAYITNRRTLYYGGTIDDPLSTTGYVHEHRIWQQALLTHKTFGKNTISHRFRMEQRFLMQPFVEMGDLKINGNKYSSRFRYFFRSVIPLKQEFPFKKGLFAGIQNEIMFNLGNKEPVNGKVFDQNRFLASAGYRVKPSIDLEFGYLNQYVQGRQSAFINNHVLQLAVYTRL